MSSDHLETSAWDAIKYDTCGAFVWRLGADLIEILDPKSGERILDVGCGTGHLTARIAEKEADVLGIDSSRAMIDRARVNYPLLRFEVIDALELKRSPEFDAVFSNATLHWITKPETAVSGMFDALKPGGRLVAEFGGKGNVSAIVAALLHAREHIGVKVLADEPWYFPSADEYTSVLKSQGFIVKSAHLFNRPTPLEGEERGLRNWLETFSERLLQGLTEPERYQVFSSVENKLRGTMFKNRTWIAEYVRLRIVALKP